MNEALRQLIACAYALERTGGPIKEFNVGGFATQHRDERCFPFSKFADMLRERVHACKADIRIEPSRTNATDAGILITRTEYLKRADRAIGQNSAIVDAMMNDLIRSAIYSTWNNIAVANK